jgi:hypothetical protein
LPRRAPTAESTRYAANLIWKPVENLQIDGELGWLDFALRTSGGAVSFRSRADPPGQLSVRDLDLLIRALN